MDIEQLKLILEAIGGLTGDAKTFGIIWLCVQTFPELLCALLWGSFLYGLFKCGLKAIKLWSDTTWSGTLRNLVSPNSEYFYSSDKRKIISFIRKGMENSE